MSSVWELGDPVEKRFFSKECFQGREFVFSITEEAKVPFLRMKPTIQRDGTWMILYRKDNHAPLVDLWRKEMRYGTLSMALFLKGTMNVLEALEMAEDRMILPGSFQLDQETIFVRKDNGRIVFLYIPQGPIWVSMPSGQCVKQLRLMGEVLDPRLFDRWPLIKEQFLEWEEHPVGRHRCIKIMKQWVKELPKEGIGRNNFGLL